MKILFSALFCFAAFSEALASEVKVVPCSSLRLSLNRIENMQSYSNSQVKAFEIDLLEPAAAPVGVAIIVETGDDISNMRSDCRFIPGLFSVDFKTSTASQNSVTGFLVLEFNVTQSDAEGEIVPKILL